MIIFNEATISNGHLVFPASGSDSGSGAVAGGEAASEAHGDSGPLGVVGSGAEAQAESKAMSGTNGATAQKKENTAEGAQTVTSSASSNVELVVVSIISGILFSLL